MKNNLQRDAKLRDLWRAGIFLASGLVMSGCGNGNLEHQKVQQGQELSRLRDENKEVQKLRVENKELPRLRKDQEELSKLRGTGDEIAKLKKENDLIRTQVVELAKTQTQRRQTAAEQARQAAINAAGIAAKQPGQGGLIATNSPDPNIPQEGDEIFVDPKFLAKILPQFDWSKLERKEPIAVKALLDQQGIRLTNYQQLIELGVTNYVVKHGPRPPAPAPAPQ